MSISIENLNKSYGICRKNPVVRNLSMTIRKGEIYALVGQNGAGKTTTIKCVLKFIKNSSGTIKYDNEDISCLMRSKKIGFMPENLAFSKTVLLQDYLFDLGSLRSVDNIKLKNRIDFFADQLELSKVLNRSISKFSKGMKKKTNFIQSVIHEPEFLVLDEPTDGLDPISRRKMLALIKEMSVNGCTILITSHILADLERICDKVGLMHDGRVIAETKPDRFDEHNDKKEIYVRTINGKNDEIENLYELSPTRGIMFEDFQRILIRAVDSNKKSLEDWYFDVLKSNEEKFNVENNKI